MREFKITRISRNCLYATFVLRESFPFHSELDEGAVALQRLIERMSSVWKFREKNYLYAQLLSVKHELSTTVRHGSV